MLRGTSAGIRDVAKNISGKNKERGRKKKFIYDCVRNTSGVKSTFPASVYYNIYIRYVIRILYKRGTTLQTTLIIIPRYDTRWIGKITFLTFKRGSCSIKLSNFFAWGWKHVAVTGGKERRKGE